MKYKVVNDIGDCIFFDDNNKQINPGDIVNIKINGITTMTNIEFIGFADYEEIVFLFEVPKTFTRIEIDDVDKVEII